MAMEYKLSKGWQRKHEEHKAAAPFELTFSLTARGTFNKAFDFPDEAKRAIHSLAKLIAKQTKD